MKERHVLVTLLRSSVATREKTAGIIAFACANPAWRLHFIPLSIDESTQKKVIESIRPDGAIDPPPFAAGLLKCPIVLIDEEIASEKHDALIHCDNVAVAQAAAEHLMNDGKFRHFAYIGADMGPGLLFQGRHSISRYDAFVQELRHLGYEGNVPCMDYDLLDSMYERSPSRLVRWLKGLPKPCGVFVYNDFSCQFVLAACHGARIKVPDQIGLMGVDNETAICWNSQPTITSIELDFKRAGFVAAKLLDRFMSGELPGSPIVENYGVKRLHARMSTQNTTGAMKKFAAAVMERIRVSEGRDISVDILAKEFGVSIRTLEYRFKQAQGRTIRDELMNVRLAAAERLLADTTVALKNIAFQTGFGTEGNLRYAFKKSRNATLRQYRNENKLR